MLVFTKDRNRLRAVRTPQISFKMRKKLANFFKLFICVVLNYSLKKHELKKRTQFSLPRPVGPVVDIFIYFYESEKLFCYSNLVHGCFVLQILQLSRIGTVENNAISTTYIYTYVKDRLTIKQTVSLDFITAYSLQKLEQLGLSLN